MDLKETGRVGVEWIHLAQDRDHPASYPVGTRGSFPGGKAASA
jgi:hypothetical protein